MAVKFYFGPEQYLLDGYKQKYLSMVQNPELNLSIMDGIQSGLYDLLYTYPVFEEKRVVLLYLDDLKQFGEDKKLLKFLSETISFTELAVFCKKADTRTKFYKSVKDQVISCEKIADTARLQGIILKEINKRGGRIREDAYSLFMEKENYLERDDISLLNIISDLDRLVSYSPEISVDTVNALIPDNPSKKMFELANMIKKADFKHLRQQAEVFAGNEIGALSALLREYRIAWKTKYFPASDIGVRPPLFSKEPEGKLLRAMEIVTAGIDAVKYGAVPKDSIMLYTFSQLMNL